MLGGADEAVPVGGDVFRRSADLRDDRGHLLGRDHLNGVPRTNLEVIGIALFARDVDADFAPDATLQIDFAPALEVLKVVVLLDLDDAIDQADLRQASQPVRLSALMTASSLGSFLRGPALAMEQTSIRIRASGGFSDPTAPLDGESEETEL